jgi:hypothetical protein
VWFVVQPLTVVQELKRMARPVLDENCHIGLERGNQTRPEPGGVQEKDAPVAPSGDGANATASVENMNGLKSQPFEAALAQFRIT